MKWADMYVYEECRTIHAFLSTLKVKFAPEDKKSLLGNGSETFKCVGNELSRDAFAFYYKM